MTWWAIFSQTQGYFGSIFIIMAVMGNFNLLFSSINVRISKPATAATSAISPATDRFIPASTYRLVAASTRRRLVPTATAASVTRASAAFAEQQRGLLREHLHSAGDLPQEVQAVVPHGLRDLQTRLR